MHRLVFVLVISLLNINSYSQTGYAQFLRNKSLKLDSTARNLFVHVDKTIYTNCWLITNVYNQKQEGYKAVGIKVRNGDIKTPIARKLISLVREIAADDLRMTSSQGILLRFVREENLAYVFEELNKLGLAEPGFESVADVTSCPGTDTCNLGISNSTGITVELENIILREYPDLIYNKDINIKISGCINACGQHALAAIGFHGSSMKIGKLVAPALQVLLGGGSTGNGTGLASDKVIKVPSKRGPQVLRTLLEDYQANSSEGELFNQYYARKGKIYFYDLLGPLANTENVTPDDFIDWGQTEQYKPEIGIGECASVVIDLVATLLFDSEEKLDKAQETLKSGDYAESIYHSYTSFVNTAKAMLISEGVKTNTQVGIIKDFDQVFVSVGKIDLPVSFQELVYQINQQEPSKEFAGYYLQQALLFKEKAAEFRQVQLAD